MKNDWLWDRKLNISQAKRILRDPGHKRFVLLAALLLARKNQPKEVFRQYLDPLLFCRQWMAIKRRMRQDRWNEPRIIFWQAIYETLRDRFREQGVGVRKERPIEKDAICKIVGKLIRNTRKELGLSQKELAEKMHISQQLISRIEKGRENISLGTLKSISEALGKRARVDLAEKIRKVSSRRP